MKVAALIALIASALPLTSLACTYSTAIYEHTENSNWRIDFVPLGRTAFQSNMSLHLEGPSKEASYWFLYDSGSAPRVALISTTNVGETAWQPPKPEGGIRPLGDLQIYAIDRQMRVSVVVPTLNDQAPEFLFIPNLTEALSGRAIPRQSLVPGVFKRINCR